jgi:hypothetical protein
LTWRRTREKKKRREERGEEESRLAVGGALAVCWLRLRLAVGLEAELVCGACASLLELLVS